MPDSQNSTERTYPVRLTRKELVAIDGALYRNGTDPSETEIAAQSKIGRVLGRALITESAMQ